MKNLELFEGFIKKYGEKISVEDFKSLKPGQGVKYMGIDYKVTETGDVLTLIDERGKKITVNYNMFNQKGAINK